MKSHEKRSIVASIRFKRVLVYGVLVVLTAIFLFPIFWLCISSFKTPLEMFRIPPTFIPKEFSWHNYYESLVKSESWHNILNSAVVGLVSTGISVSIGTLAAYGFSWCTFRGSKPLFWSILSMRMIPVVAIVIPFFIILRKLNLFDRQFGLIMVYVPCQLPFVIWLMESFFKALPSEILEAALIDGCSKIAVFIRVAFPLAAPGVSAAAILTFISAWNELFLALILTSSRAKTMPVALAELVTTWEVIWGSLFAGAVIFTVPILIFTFFVQKYIIKGLLGGAIKG